MSINQLPQTPNVGNQVPNDLWKWLIEIGNRIRTLIDGANAGHASTHATGGSDELTPLTGAVVQVAHYETGAVATGSASIPLDDTIPQISEGTQFLSVSITPKSSSNKLIINVNLILRCAAVAGVTAALFQDLTANALAAANSDAAGANYTANIAFCHSMPAGTTSATTFIVRAGSSTGSVVTVNGLNGGRLFGGVMASSIMVTEVQA